MKRNIAFFISTNNKNTTSYQKARSHLIGLAKRFNYSFYEDNFNNAKIIIVYEKELTFLKKDDFFSFPIGNLGDQPLEWDRFLFIKITADKIECINDYAGSIPVFYSLRGYLSLSNIEPCVVLDSNTTIDDFSFENIYGFLKYSHFIWNETAFKHVFTCEPDSRYEFFFSPLSISSEYLGSVKGTEERVDLSDKEVAAELYELNQTLVFRSLEPYERIILPLSSGYDSRMIFAALVTKPEFSSKLNCFTYGVEGSIEVEAAREMCEGNGVAWKFIDLPCSFLERNYLLDIYSIFGSSLHMHGMYQIEFFNEIAKNIHLSESTCLTSGFMTGVPAGQHNGLLGITSTKSLSEAMSRFTQSRYWTKEELKKMFVFQNKDYDEQIEERFQKAFKRFEGNVYQKAVMFDVWTRQRNFISYYPRALEWKIVTVSPHMTTTYAQFFMSLSEKHLSNRYAVELMFKFYYPSLAKIVSNSNSIRTISSTWKNMLCKMAFALKAIHLGFLLPQKYSFRSFDLDLQAIKKIKEEGLYPLTLINDHLKKFLLNFFEPIQLDALIKNAKSDTQSYNKLLTFQSLAFELIKIEGLL